MDGNQSSNYVLILMKNLNLIIILYISVIMAYSLSGYIQENSALEFLIKIENIPISAWKVPVVAVGLYISCLLIMYMGSTGSTGVFLKVCLEIVLGFCISYTLGFNYTGIVLLILADTMKYFSKSKWRFPFAVIICLVYLLIDYDLMSAYLDVIPLEAYLEYYQTDVRLVMLGIKNSLSSLNTFVFLVYMIILMRIQMSEKERILSLNERLNTMNDELQRANIQLEEYAKEAEKMIETRERNRLAREIHDTLGHALTGIITGIEACVALIDLAPEATKIQLESIGEVARQGMTDVRRSVNALRPDALEKFDLEKALLNVVNEMRNATKVEIVYHCMTSLNCFNDDEEEIIYRIVQESTTNSIRHGKAKRIQININREYNMLKIHIQDNGIGCKNIKKGFGLHHMEERLNMLQGKLCYNGENGFVVEAQIPIRWGKEETNND